MTRRVTALAAAVLTSLALAVALPSARAGAATQRLPFGCANPANHAAAKLLPALAGRAGGRLTCFGRATLGPHASDGPQGYGPAEIQAAYGLAGRRSGGRTVAIVDAYDDPRAEADLAVFRRTYHLPPCTTANGCFRKVNQNGRRTPLPDGDYGWAEEISLDLDAVSAACPDCRLLLVEATSPDTGPLMAAVDSAVRLGAAAVSLSFGGDEDRTILAADRHLNHPGVAITASSGDDGYGVSWPASSRYVTAVGGTTLRRASGRWSETAWSGAGSGCSKYETKPAWQHDRGCARRTVADVAADADPETGLAVYDTYNNCPIAALCNGLLAAGLAQGLNGWAQVGGTSLSSPIVAAVYALAGRKHTARTTYAAASSLTDVRSGSNGSCGGSYLCTAKPGYDGPTGLGTPKGLLGF
jgi:subtilase family serine protease